MDDVPDDALSPQGGGTALLVGRSNFRYAFEIRDTGIGIAPDKVDNLFGIFSQLDSSITRKYGGTGLGLAICKHLVTLMGGDIWAESSGRSGEGSTFTFTIETQTLPAEPPAFLTPDHPALAGQRTLVLCCHHRTRRVIEDQLKFWGMQVEGFADFDVLSASWKPDGSADIVLFGSSFMKADVEGALVEKLPRHGVEDLKWVQIKAPGLLSSPEEKNGIDGYLDAPIKPGQLFRVLNQILRDMVELESGASRDRDRVEPKGFRILLAEDDPTNQILIALLLEKMGYRVETAVSGLEVLQILEQERFDVIIMDLQMPEMDGLTATRYIREILPKDDQPFIIALTADSRRETMQESILEGVDLFLTKPMRKKVLQQVLNDLEMQKEIQTEPTKDQVSTDQSPLDYGVLSDLLDTFDGDPDGIAQLLGSFTANAPKIMEALKSSLQSQDWDQVLVKAHALKGSCELFGAVNLAELCNKVENTVREGKLDGVNRMVVEIEKEYDRVKLAMDRKLKNES